MEPEVRGRAVKTGVARRAWRQGREERRARVKERAGQVPLWLPWWSDREPAAVVMNVGLLHEPGPPAGELAAR